jgi:hypothetical protein
MLLRATLMDGLAQMGLRMVEQLGVTASPLALEASRFADGLRIRQEVRTDRDNDLSVRAMTPTNPGGDRLGWAEFHLRPCEDSF